MSVSHCAVPVSPACVSCWCPLFVWLQAEPAKKTAEPAPPPSPAKSKVTPGDTKEAGEGKKKGISPKKLGAPAKKEAEPSGAEAPKEEGGKKAGAKKPSVLDRLMAKDKEAKGPAPKRTLADLLGKEAGKQSAATSAQGGGGRCG